MAWDAGVVAAAGAYHAHLDACARCRRSPFDQCPVGVELLQAFAQAIAEARR